MLSTVTNLKTGETQTYSLEPIEALISAAILEDKKASSITCKHCREEYRGKIIRGKYSASIRDLTVLTKGAK